MEAQSKHTKFLPSISLKIFSSSLVSCCFISLSLSYISSFLLCVLHFFSNSAAAQLRKMKESASINCKRSIKGWLIEIEKDEESNLASKCSIYRVPQAIRKINADAYTPKMISIGPLHHGKPELADMEKKKRMYVKSLLDKIPAGNRDQKEEKIIAFVQDNEQLIRASYAETIKFESFEFVKMIISDAFFIIQHFLNTFRHIHSWLGAPVVRYSLNMDLLLLENKLPYFVLKKICDLLDLPQGADEFLKNFVSFFTCFQLEISDQPEEPKHFTDLIRTALVKSCPEKEERKGSIRDLPCAVQLHESGVKFKSTTGRGLLDVRFRKRKQLVPFLTHELQIPCLTIYDDTECLLRNVMALEQCCYPSDTRLCNYVWLLDCLINNEKDVELLVAEGVISNSVGDIAQVANMFNKISSYIILDENSSHHECCEELKDHYKNPQEQNQSNFEKRIFQQSLERHSNFCGGYTPAPHSGTDFIFNRASCVIPLNALNFAFISRS